VDVLISIVFCVGLFIVIVLAIGSSFLQSRYTLTQWVLDRINYLLVRLLWRASAPTELPIKDGQGAIIVANHRSSVDPVFIHLVARRRVRWMVAKEYCDHTIFGWFLGITGAIPTRRGGVDSAAIRHAVQLLQQGQWVGILPEGRINMTDQVLNPVRPGAALIARRAGVPIVPVYIEGAPFDCTPESPFRMPANVTVSIGSPIDVSRFQNDEAAILEVARQIIKLAGIDDVDPVLAGKNWKPSDEEIQRLHAETRSRRRRPRR